MFLVPGMVCAWYVTQTPIPAPIAIDMKRYLFARQNPDDGGWGLHIEGESTAYGTTMTYVVLRLLGANEEDERMVKARGMLHQLGGAVKGPHWAKFWLAVLGVMEWEPRRRPAPGAPRPAAPPNPVPPELWYVNAGADGLMVRMADHRLQAPSRLGTYRSLALVDTHAYSFPANVLHLLQEICYPSDSFDPPNSGGDLYPKLLLYQVFVAS